MKVLLQFIPGLVCFAFLGGCVALVGGNVGERVDDAACSHAHADYIVQRKAMAECTVANNCVLTSDAFLKLERAEANVIAQCPAAEEEKK